MQTGDRKGFWLIALTAMLMALIASGCGGGSASNGAAASSSGSPASSSGSTGSSGGGSSSSGGASSSKVMSACVSYENSGADGNTPSNPRSYCQCLIKYLEDGQYAKISHNNSFSPTDLLNQFQQDNQQGLPFAASSYSGCGNGNSGQTGNTGVPSPGNVGGSGNSGNSGNT